MIVCDLDGNVVGRGDLAPSSDTAAHAYVYRHMPEVGGVVHTHSTYASAWAARGEPIPCVLTAMADEFGGEIPVGPFALIGDDSIGRGIVETLPGHRSPRRADAQPRRLHHRPGRPRRGQGRGDVRGRRPHRPHRPAARRAAADRRRPTIDALFDRYQNVYGQRPPEGAVAMTPAPNAARRPRGLVPHRQPGPVRRGDAAPGRRAVAARSPRPCDAAPDIPVTRRVEAGAHRPRRDPPAVPRRQRRRRGASA